MGTYQTSRLKRTTATARCNRCTMALVVAWCTASGGRIVGSTTQSSSWVTMRVSYCLSLLRGVWVPVLGFQGVVGRRRRRWCGWLAVGLAHPSPQPCVLISQMLDRNLRCHVLCSERFNFNEVQELDHDLPCYSITRCPAIMERILLLF